MSNNQAVIPTELVARLEAASAGSRAFNAEIARHFGWTEQSDEADPVYTNRVTMWWFAPGETIEEAVGSQSPPDFTNSIDEALALAERLGLNGWKTLYAAMMHWKAHDARGPLSQTLPLAMCLVFLRANADRPGAVLLDQTGTTPALLDAANTGLMLALSRGEPEGGFVAKIRGAIAASADRTTTANSVGTEAEGRSAQNTPPVKTGEG